MKNKLLNTCSTVHRVPNSMHSRSTGELIEGLMLNDCKKRHTNLDMAWISYKKAYDMIPQSLTLESLDLVKVSENIVKVIRKSMKNCKNC